MFVFSFRDNPLTKSVPSAKSNLQNIGILLKEERWSVGFIVAEVSYGYQSFIFSFFIPDCIHIIRNLNPLDWGNAVSVLTQEMAQCDMHGVWGIKTTDADLLFYFFLWPWQGTSWDQSSCYVSYKISLSFQIIIGVSWLEQREVWMSSVR